MDLKEALGAVFCIQEKGVSMKTLSKRMQVVVGALVTILSFGAMAQDAMVLDLSKSQTKVNFHADGKIMKVHGENGKATGSFAIQNGAVSGSAIVELKDLTTGISLRDEHMKDKYLEIKKHPKAIFEITDMKLPANFDGEAEVPFRGKLTVHGVANPVAGTAKLSKSGASLKGDVEFNTSISKHKIELPKYSGIVIKDEVKVKVQFDGQLKKGAASKSVAKK